MRTYYLVLIILIAITIIISIPSVAMILVFLTIGLGIILWVAGTALLYWLCLFPAAYLWQSNRIIGIITSVILCLVAAFLPYELMKKDVQPVIDEIAQSNVDAETIINSRTIEIIKKSYSKSFKSSHLCEAECRGLLLSGKVDWIRHTDQTQTDEPKNSFFKVATGSECNVEGMTNTDNICILSAPDNGEPAGLEITYEATQLKKDNAKTKMLENLEHVTATEVKNGKKVLIYKQSSPTILLPVRPTIIIIAGSGMNTAGQQILKDHTVYNEISLNRTLNDLGYVYKPMAKPKRSSKNTNGPDIELTREMLAILNLPDNGDFTREQSEFINRWVSAAQRLEIYNERQIDLLKRIVKETRHVNSRGIEHIYSRNQYVAKQLLPVILDVLENNPKSIQSNLNGTAVSSLSYSLNTTDPQTLKQYRAQIIKLSNQYHGLQRTIGLLDIDPRPYLLPITYPQGRLELEYKEQEDLHSRLIAICRSDEKWKSVLLPELQKAADNAPIPTGSGETYSDLNEYRYKLAKTLARFGDIERAKSLYLKGLSEHDLKRLKQRSSPKESLSRRCPSIYF